MPLDQSLCSTGMHVRAYMQIHKHPQYIYTRIAHIVSPSLKSDPLLSNAPMVLL